MGLFSRKKPSPVNAAAALAAAAVVNTYTSQPSAETERDICRIQKDMRKQAKAAEKERKQAAKRAMKIMKDQVKRARKDKKKQEKETKRQTYIMRRMQKKEERTRRRLIRKRKKDEKRRRKQLAKQAKKAGQQQQQVAQAAAEVQHINPAEQVHDGVRPATAPTFRQSEQCFSCCSPFRKFPIRLRHHCRNCGDSFCNSCMSSVKRPIPWFKLPKPEKVCYSCDVRVFNGMGGAIYNPPTEAISAPQSVSSQSARTAPEASPVQRARSGSNPASESSAASPTSRLRINLRSRSRKDATSSKSRRNSLWTLPIRPLLKRKQSRNRWDLEIHMEKAEMLARQRQALVLNVTNQPQFALAS